MQFELTFFIDCMNFRKAILLMTIYSLFSSATYAQNPWLDSMHSVADVQKEDINKVWTLITLSEAYKFTYADSGLYYGRQALSLAEKLKFDVGIFWSIVAIDKSLYTLGNYSLELDYAFKAYPLGKKLNQTSTIGWANGTLGDCYFNLGDYNSALKYYREVIKTAEEKSLIDLSSIYSATVPVFVKLHLYDSALIYAKKGYELFKINPLLNNENSDDGKYSKCFTYRFLGEAYVGKNDYSSALYYFHLSLLYTEMLDLQLNKIDLYNDIAAAFKSKEILDSATWYSKAVIAENITQKYPAGLLKAASTLSDIYDLQHQPDSTLKYLRMAYNLNDSLFNHEKIIAFKNILFKEQEKQNEVKAATLEVQNRYRMYFVVVLVIISVIIAGIIIRNRRIRQLQTIRNSIADDLHDDIGSTLSSISIMNELAKERSPEALPLLTSIGESTSAIQENMSDIVWTINPKNDQFENVLQRMQLFASEILDAKSIQLEFDTDTSLNSTKLTMKQRKNLYLFFKEAINNAAKHSGAKKIIINIIKKENNIEMNISDDGSGFNTSAIFGGNGMNSLKKRADELNAVYDITSITNEGTTVQLKFRIV